MVKLEDLMIVVIQATSVIRAVLRTVKELNYRGRFNPQIYRQTTVLNLR